jgi:hypothetical protein
MGARRLGEMEICRFLKERTEPAKDDPKKNVLARKNTVRVHSFSEAVGRGDLANSVRISTGSTDQQCATSHLRESSGEGTRQRV